ncbi:MAG TPA: hypothetical protein EYQ83_07920 [Acidobacteria bacterium]|nr:hypothetical protein [Acidobacteriota bacterium]
MTIIDTPEPTTPKRDLNAFLVAMSVALHRYSVYPSDHPSIGPGVGDVLRRANELLADRATSAFDVARRQLIIDGVATDSNQPVLRRLAEGLHAHHLGAVSLQSGIQVDEIAHTLLLLSTEPQREGQLGLTRDGQVPVWPHLKLHPLTFDGLSTRRPCREAWESEKTTKSLEDRSGTEFDPELVSAFVKMLREGGSARTGPHR